MTFTVGLTGGIGSGKTAVSARLAKLGATVVDTDEISRALTAAGGAAMERVREAFGGRYVAPDGSLDRAAMRTLAFEDAAARAKLEAILHPAIRSEADRALGAATGPYALLVVPLLLETGGYAGRVDRILVVDCPEALQVARASERSRIAAEDVRRIMRAQWPRWRRLQLADDVVWNGGGLAALDTQCAALHERYRRPARGGR
jgi:dephospho-CoA kinase